MDKREAIESIIAEKHNFGEASVRDALDNVLSENFPDNEIKKIIKGIIKESNLTTSFIAYTTKYLELSIAQARNGATTSQSNNQQKQKTKQSNNQLSKKEQNLRNREVNFTNKVLDKIGNGISKKNRDNHVSKKTKNEYTNIIETKDKDKDKNKTTKDLEDLKKFNNKYKKYLLPNIDPILEEIARSKKNEGENTEEKKEKLDKDLSILKWKKETKNMKKRLTKNKDLLLSGEFFEEFNDFLESNETQRKQVKNNFNDFNLSEINQYLYETEQKHNELKNLINAKKEEINKKIKLINNLEEKVNNLKEIVNKNDYILTEGDDFQNKMNQLIEEKRTQIENYYNNPIDTEKVEIIKNINEIKDLKNKTKEYIEEERKQKNKRREFENKNNLEKIEKEKELIEANLNRIKDTKPKIYDGYKNIKNKMEEEDKNIFRFPTEKKAIEERLKEWEDIKNKLNKETSIKTILKFKKTENQTNEKLSEDQENILFNEYFKFDKHKLSKTFKQDNKSHVVKYLEKLHKILENEENETKFKNLAIQLQTKHKNQTKNLNISPVPIQFFYRDIIKQKFFFDNKNNSRYNTDENIYHTQNPFTSTESQNKIINRALGYAVHKHIKEEIGIRNFNKKNKLYKSILYMDKNANKGETLIKEIKEELNKDIIRGSDSKQRRQKKIRSIELQNLGSAINEGANLKNIANILNDKDRDDGIKIESPTTTSQDLKEAIKKASTKLTFKPTVKEKEEEEKEKIEIKKISLPEDPNGTENKEPKFELIDDETDIPEPEIEDENEIVTEYLAETYLIQEEYTKAIEVYKKLIKKSPEKEDLFTKKIKKIKEIKEKINEKIEITETNEKDKNNEEIEITDDEKGAEIFFNNLNQKLKTKYDFQNMKKNKISEIFIEKTNISKEDMQIIIDTIKKNSYIKKLSLNKCTIDEIPKEIEDIKIDKFQIQYSTINKIHENIKNATIKSIDFGTSNISEDDFKNLLQVNGLEKLRLTGDINTMTIPDELKKTTNLKSLTIAEKTNFVYAPELNQDQANKLKINRKENLREQTRDEYYKMTQFSVKAIENDIGINSKIYSNIDSTEERNQKEIKYRKAFNGFHKIYKNIKNINQTTKKISEINTKIFDKIKKDGQSDEEKNKMIKEISITIGEYYNENQFSNDEEKINKDIKKIIASMGIEEDKTEEQQKIIETNQNPAEAILEKIKQQQQITNNNKKALNDPEASDFIEKIKKHQNNLDLTDEDIKKLKQGDPGIVKKIKNRINEIKQKTLFKKENIEILDNTTITSIKTILSILFKK